MRDSLTPSDSPATRSPGESYKRLAAGVQPPADLNQPALNVHALEDGLLIQRLICPNDTNDAVVVDAVDLLIHSWIALARDKDTPEPEI